MQRTEIYTDGTYLAHNPDWGEEDAVYKVGWLNKLLVKHPRTFETVVEVGCGSGKVLSELCSTLGTATRYTGYDISPEAIRRAEKFKTHQIDFVHGDYFGSTASKADLVVTFDVVEHIPDYYGFLGKLRVKGNYFAFHIPLDLCCRTLLKPHVLLQQRDAVGHIHYFSREMVLWMLKDTGYEVIDWMYTPPLGDIKNASNLRQGIKKILRRFSFAVNNNLSADLWGNYSMMILAK